MAAPDPVRWFSRESCKIAEVTGLLKARETTGANAARQPPCGLDPLFEVDHSRPGVIMEAGSFALPNLEAPSSSWRWHDVTGAMEASLMGKRRYDRRVRGPSLRAARWKCHLLPASDESAVQEENDHDVHNQTV
jgi:hypothetical protein